MSRPISHRSHHVRQIVHTRTQHTHAHAHAGRHTLLGSARFRIDSLLLLFVLSFSLSPPRRSLLRPFTPRSFSSCPLVDLCSLSHLLSASRSSSSTICISTFLLPPESYASSSPRYIIIADRSHDHCRGHQRPRSQQQSLVRTRRALRSESGPSGIARSWLIPIARDRSAVDVEDIHVLVDGTCSDSRGTFPRVTCENDERSARIEERSKSALFF